MQSLGECSMIVYVGDNNIQSLFEHVLEEFYILGTTSGPEVFPLNNNISIYGVST